MWNCLHEWNGSATSNDLKTAKTNLASARTELNSTKSAVSHLATELKGKINKNCFHNRERREIKSIEF